MTAFAPLVLERWKRLETGEHIHMRLARRKQKDVKPKRSKANRLCRLNEGFQNSRGFYFHAIITGGPPSEIGRGYRLTIWLQGKIPENNRARIIFQAEVDTLSHRPLIKVLEQFKIGNIKEQYLSHKDIEKRFL